MGKVLTPLKGITSSSDIFSKFDTLPHRNFNGSNWRGRYEIYGLGRMERHLDLN
jgi:hypothetical protein